MVGKGQRWNSDGPAFYLRKDGLAMVSEYCFFGHKICYNLKDNNDIDKQIRSSYCRAKSLKRNINIVLKLYFVYLFKTICLTIYCPGL